MLVGRKLLFSACWWFFEFITLNFVLTCSFHMQDSCRKYDSFHGVSVYCFISHLILLILYVILVCVYICH